MMSQDQETKNPRTGSPIIRCQAIGATAGALVSIALYLYATGHPLSIWSVGGWIAFGITAPALAVWSLLGLPIENTGPLAFQFACLAVFMNALEGFIIGTLLGWVRKKSKKK
jgi:hypothetical protein